MRNIISRFFLIGVLLGSGLGAGVMAFLYSAEAYSRNQAKIPQELKGQLNQPNKTDKMVAPDYPQLKQGQVLTDRSWVELNKIVNPAVVNISTSTIVRRGPPSGGGMGRDPFFDFFEQFMGPPGTNGFGGGGRPRAAQALGTGFIVSEDGLIITNNHVVEGADVIKVQITEKSEKTYEAQILGRDQRADIALLKIEGGNTKFPVVQLGSSKEVEVGENVAAFGNPFGLGHSMTKGIISAKDRPIDEINRFPFLQTDALINPGNSGGPLVNLKGMVIGVNTAINAAGQGIGFAIPIDEVKSVIVQLQKFGTIKKGYLGVGLQDLNPRAASYLGLKTLEGALVSYVEPGSPAAKAGIKELDVITEFGSKKIRSSLDLRNAAGDSQIGSEVAVKLLREGKEKKVTVTMSEAPAEPRKIQPQQRTLQPPAHKDKQGFGLKVSALTPELRSQLNIGKDVKGAVITEVEPDSLAAFAGLQPGDVVIQVNSSKVNSPEEVLTKLKNGSNALTVVRGGVVMSIFIGAGE